jgi:hypothetical protein
VLWRVHIEKFLVTCLQELRHQLGSLIVRATFDHLHYYTKAYTTHRFHTQANVVSGTATVTEE